MNSNMNENDPGSGPLFFLSIAYVSRTGPLPRDQTSTWRDRPHTFLFKKTMRRSLSVGAAGGPRGAPSEALLVLGSPGRPAATALLVPRLETSPAHAACSSRKADVTESGSRSARTVPSPSTFAGSFRRAAHASQLSFWCLSGRAPPVSATSQHATLGNAPDPRPPVAMSSPDQPLLTPQVRPRVLGERQPRVSAAPPPPLSAATVPDSAASTARPTLHRMDSGSSAGSSAAAAPWAVARALRVSLGGAAPLGPSATSRSLGPSASSRSLTGSASERSGKFNRQVSSGSDGSDSFDGFGAWRDGVDAHGGGGGSDSSRFGSEIFSIVRSAPSDGMAPLGEEEDVIEADGGGDARAAARVASAAPADIRLAFSVGLDLSGASSHGASRASGYTSGALNSDSSGEMSPPASGASSGAPLSGGGASESRSAASHAWTLIPRLSIGGSSPSGGSALTGSTGSPARSSIGSVGSGIVNESHSPSAAVGVLDSSADRSSDRSERSCPLLKLAAGADAARPSGGGTKRSTVQRGSPRAAGAALSAREAAVRGRAAAAADGSTPHRLRRTLSAAEAPSSTAGATLESTAAVALKVAARRERHALARVRSSTGVRRTALSFQDEFLQTIAASAGGGSDTWREEVARMPTTAVSAAARSGRTGRTPR